MLGKLNDMSVSGLAKDAHFSRELIEDKCVRTCYHGFINMFVIFYYKVK